MPNLTKYVKNDNITYVVEKYWLKKMSLKWKISDICFMINPKKCRSIIVLMTSRHFYILYYK